MDSIPGYNLISNPVVYKNIFSHFFSPNFKKKINFPSHWPRVLTLKWEKGTFFEKVVLVSSHQTCHIQQVKSHSIIYHVQMKLYIHSGWKKNIPKDARYIQSLYIFNIKTEMCMLVKNTETLWQTYCPCKYIVHASYC